MRSNIAIPAHVDRTGIRAGQTMTLVLLLTAFVLGAWSLAAAVGVANLVGAWRSHWGVFGIVYQRFLVARGMLTPRLVVELPAPHRFAQAFSGTVTVAGAALVAIDVTTVGWTLVVLVAGLAAVNVTLSFCAGCFTYYQLARLGVPGFGRTT
jgi:hypothetical protein